jgi:hypothetical protein
VGSAGAGGGNGGGSLGCTFAATASALTNPTPIRLLDLDMRGFLQAFATPPCARRTPFGIATDQGVTLM